MNKILSVRPFIGAKDYTISRSFYTEFGFKEYKTSPKLSYFYIDNFGFYLQDAHVKDWVDNTMLFLEVDDLKSYHIHLLQKELHLKYDNVRLSSIQFNDWGNEFFLHDPSGILWHIGEFNFKR